MHARWRAYASSRLTAGPLISGREGGVKRKEIDKGAKVLDDRKSHLRDGISKSVPDEHKESRGKRLSAD